MRLLLVVLLLGCGAPKPKLGESCNGSGSYKMLSCSDGQLFECCGGSSDFCGGRQQGVWLVTQICDRGCAASGASCN